MPLVPSYIKKLKSHKSPIHFSETINKKNKTNEIIGFGIRTTSGILVDKFSSRKLVPYINLPMLLGLTLLFLFDHSLISYLFFGLLGMSNGLANVLGSSTWAEIYGVKFIGSIKALTTAFMVFSTAFGTAVFGLMIDNGFSIENIAFVSGIYIVISLFLLILIRNKLEPIKLRK